MDVAQHFVDESTLLSRLEARRCLPLSAAEVAELRELVRRATGGCLLLTPPDSLSPAKFPSAWLTEFAALSRPHVVMMGRASRVDAAAKCYDPLPGQ